MIRLAKLAGIGLLLLLLFIALVYLGVFGHIPNEDELKAFKQSKASLVYSEDEELIGKIFYEDRAEVQLNTLPAYLIEALVATEDARYYEHEGLDSKSLLRVLVKSIILNQDAGGGSTITQQLAKNMYGRSGSGVFRLTVSKVREMIIARRLESVYSKDDILLLYLTQVPFGENIFGIESASQRFFNKKARNLSLEEGAVLIGLLKGNTLYNPRMYPEQSLERRNVVISQMNVYGYLTDTQKDSFQALPLTLDYSNFNTNGPANYFLDQVKIEAQALVEAYNEANGTDLDIREDGLKVSTTLNFQAQEAGLKAFQSHLPGMQTALRNHYFKWNKKGLSSVVEPELKKQNLEARADHVHPHEVFSWEGYYSDSLSVRDSLAMELTLLHAGLFALDPKTGAIRTWIGGIDHRRHPYDQVYAKRQMASSFKPILYAAALEDGVDPCLRLENDSLVLMMGSEPWSPSNYDNSYGGTYSLKGALVKSMNIPTVNLYFETSFRTLQRVWKDLGFTSNLSDRPVTALGTVDASLYEEAVAYAAFANGGFKVEPYMIEKIETSDGVVLYQHQAKKPKRVLSEKTAKLMSYFLRSAVLEGTGQRMLSYGIAKDFAGKTGTSQNYADAWFIGFNPKIVMASRAGAVTPKIHFSSGTGSGSVLALPLVGITLAKVSYQNTGKKWRASFDTLPGPWNEEVDCPDFMEDSLLREWLEQLKRDEEEGEEGTDEEKKTRRRKKLRDFFRDVLGT